MAQQTLNDGEGGDVIRGKINDNFTELYGMTLVEDDQLVEWAQSKSYEPQVITRDAEGRVTSMTVLWPDDSVGTYTATDYNATHEVYDGFEIIHTDSGKTIDQSAVTRNVDGAITNKPELTVI